MTGKQTARWAVLVVAAIAAAWLVPAAVWRPLPVVVGARPDRFTVVRGVAHVHSTESDGGGSIPEIASAAADAGLDFVVVTDHNTFAGKPLEGYGPEGVLTIVGTEISNHEGHLLALGLPAPGYRFSGDGLDALGDLHDLDGFGIAAHPESPRPDLRWTGWELPGDWGLEVLNGDSQWRAAGWAAVVGALLRYPVNSTYALLALMQRPPTLDRWDTLLARRHTPAIAGADAHGTLRPSTTSLPLPSYEAVFRVAQNYVLLDAPLTGDATIDSVAILRAIRAGHSYIGLGGLADASRFAFTAARENERWSIGDSISWGAPVELQAGGAMPANARVLLYRNGSLVSDVIGPLRETVDEPGVYRVEVQVPGWEIPWVVSNPIYIATDEQRVARQTAALLPPAPSARPTTVVEPFSSASSFAVTGDETTAIEQPFMDLAGGRDGSPAARLAFALGRPDPDHPSPFASLGSYEARDWSGAGGLVVWVRSDRPSRLWVQVRDRNPTAYDGAESWYASVKATPSWRPVTIPFDTLRTTDPGSDGTLDLDAVAAIVFLVDTGTHAPGTEGVIWIDDLSLY